VNGTFVTSAFPWPKAEPFVLLAGRMLIATIFLHEAIVKIGKYEAAVAYTVAFGLPGTLLPLAIAVELGCGLALAVGVGARVASVILALFCIGTAVIFHMKFSEANQLLHFEKNLAMAGGLLGMMLTGPGCLTVPELMARIRA
jgi:putative oxidoreductase